LAFNAGGGLVSQFAASTAFEGAFAGFEQVGRNFASGDRWSQGVGSAIISSILFQGVSEALSHRREILQVGRRLLKAGNNLADDFLRVFRGPQWATVGGVDGGLFNNGNNVPVQSNRPLAASINGGGGGAHNLDPDLENELEELFDDIPETKRNPGTRKASKGANKKDRKQIDAIAREFKINRRDFGDFVEEQKKAEGRGGADNFTFEELRNLADEFSNF